MSLILDALRKSEAERRRGQAPDLHSPGPVITRPLRRHGGPGTTAFIVVALLLIAAVAWLVFAPEAAVAPVAQEEAAPAPETIASGASDTPAPSPISAPAMPVQAPEPTPTPTPPSPVASAPPATSVLKPALMPAAKPVAETTPSRDAPPAPPVAVAPANEPALPGIAFLPVEQRSALPPLKISMHVWSEQPAERFAIIDGQRVGEGARVPGGLVAEIRRDGVVLEVDGRLYLVPRP